ncbi:hypothetical protein DsansV1_C19g0158691 [Dioscorea sansibarensis]
MPMVWPPERVTRSVVSRPRLLRVLMRKLTLEVGGGRLAFVTLAVAKVRPSRRPSGTLYNRVTRGDSDNIRARHDLATLFIYQRTQIVNSLKRGLAQRQVRRRILLARPTRRPVQQHRRVTSLHAKPNQH